MKSVRERLQQSWANAGAGRRLVPGGCRSQRVVRKYCSREWILQHHVFRMSTLEEGGEDGWGGETREMTPVPILAGDNQDCAEQWFGMDGGGGWERCLYSSTSDVSTFPRRTMCPGDDHHRQTPTGGERKGQK